MDGGEKKYPCKQPTKPIYMTVSVYLGNRNMTKDTGNTAVDEKKRLDLKFKAAEILRDKRTVANPPLRAAAAEILKE